MAAYSSTEYLKAYESKFNPGLYFQFVVNGITDPNYDTETVALNKVIQYDSQFLPKLPTTDTSTSASNIFTFKYYDGTRHVVAELQGYVAHIDPNTSAIGWGDPTVEESDIKHEVQEIYNTIDQVIITNPSDAFEPAVLSELIRNVNLAFGIDLPTGSAGTYNYSKIDDTWIKDET